MTVQSAVPAFNNPLCEPEEQYAVVLLNGPHATDPNVESEYAICMPIAKLDRKLRAGDGVHARLHKLDLTCDVVRKVASRDGRPVLTPLVKDPSLEDVPIDDKVEIKGFVLTYQQSLRMR
jgi:hypothetical protein